MPDTINSRRFSNFAKRLLNMKAVNPVQELGPDVVAVLPIDRPDSAENQAVRGIRPWGFSYYGTATAAAGGTSDAIFLANPIDSNLLSVLSGVSIVGSIPDATGQPGDGAIAFVSRPTPGTTGLLLNCIEKDARALPIATYSNLQQTPAHAAPQVVLAGCQWGALIGPAPSVHENFSVRHEFVDLVLVPNSYCEFGIFLQTATVATWHYVISAWGYERMMQETEAHAQSL